MNKELKSKLIKHNEEMRAAFPNLYDQRWVEKAADQGWKDVVKSLDQAVPGFAKTMNERTTNIFATVYYCAFEKALNTFFGQCLDDSMTAVELTMHELQKITAEITTKEV